MPHIPVKVSKSMTKELKKRGGVRPNSGRPKGSMSEERRLRSEAMRRYKLRVAHLTDRLLNSQLALALGETNLYVTKTSGSGEKQRKTTEMVTDTQTIISYLNGELKGAKEEYYYIATKSPDLRAIDTLLDRAYGKAIQHVEVDLSDERQGVMPVSQKVLDQFRDYMLHDSRDINSVLEAEVVDDYTIQKSNEEQAPEHPEV